MSGISTALWRGPITQNRDPRSGVKTVSMFDVLERAQVLLGGKSQGKGRPESLLCVLLHRFKCKENEGSVLSFYILGSISSLTDRGNPPRADIQHSRQMSSCRN